MKQTKAFFSALLSLALFTGCTAQSSPLIDLSRLQGEDGGYSYMDVAWRSSPQEVSQQLGVTLEDPLTFYHQDDGSFSDHLYVLSDLSFEGEQWRAEYQFDEDGLFSVQFLLLTSPENGDKLYRSLSGQLEKAYGGAHETLDDSRDWTDGSVMQWREKSWSASGEEGGTRLWVACFQLEENEKANIGFGVLCEAPK